MDTFDWYGPVYEKPQRERDLVNKMKDAGLTNVRRRPTRGMAVVGEAPAQTQELIYGTPAKGVS